MVYGQGDVFGADIFFVSFSCAWGHSSDAVLPMTLFGLGGVWSDVREAAFCPH